MKFQVVSELYVFSHTRFDKIWMDRHTKYCTPKTLFLIIDPAHDLLVLIKYASSEGSGRINVKLM